MIKISAISCLDKEAALAKVAAVSNHNKEVRVKKPLTATGETAMVTVNFYGRPAPIHAVDSAHESAAV